jgi:hypothetical protein
VWPSNFFIGWERRKFQIITELSKNVDNFMYKIYDNTPSEPAAMKELSGPPKELVIT